MQVVKYRRQAREREKKNKLFSQTPILYSLMQKS